MAALVVLWCNYVPGTGWSERTPWAVFDETQRNRFVDSVPAHFADLNPMFVISGDEQFMTPVQPRFT